MHARERICCQFWWDSVASMAVEPILSLLLARVSGPDIGVGLSSRKARTVVRLSSDGQESNSPGAGPSVLTHQIWVLSVVGTLMYPPTCPPAPHAETTLLTKFKECSKLGGMHQDECVCTLVRRIVSACEWGGIIRDTRSFIDSRIPHGYGVPRVYLRRLRSNIEAVMGLSTWHMCSKMCLGDSIFMRQNPRSKYFFSQEPPVVGCFGIYQRRIDLHI